MKMLGQSEQGDDNELQNKLEGNIDLKMHKFFDLSKRLKSQIRSMAAREKEALAELH